MACLILPIPNFIKPMCKNGQIEKGKTCVLQLICAEKLCAKNMIYSATVNIPIKGISTEVITLFVNSNVSNPLKKM